MCKHDVISINRNYAFSETALGNSGPSGAAIAQFLGFRFQVSAPPPAKKTAGQIEKETLKKRISNNECRISKECILSIFKKKMERSDSTLRHSLFDIRYSAVRCSVRLPTAKATSLIISKPCHFGVVSYKRFEVP